MLECLDGTRCNVQNSGWSCCENHLGRAKCPQDLPVMCEDLCGGDTEYCCGTSCEPRGCSLMLRTDAYQDLLTTTTVTTVTTSAPPAVEDPGLFDNFDFEWHDSMLLWLLIIVPCNCVCIWCCWNSIRRKKEREKLSQQKHPAGLKSDVDKDGSFKLVKPFHLGRDVEKGKGKGMKVHEKILVHELPLSRPLGLELEECEVVRVHAQGAKWGWQVGDIIFEVADKPVTTFAEVYKIITDEKKRPPVKFSVWREASTAMAVMASSQQAKPADVAGARPADRGSKAVTETDISDEDARRDVLRESAVTTHEVPPLAGLGVPGSPSSSSYAESAVGLEDVNDDVPPDLAARFSPWAMEVAAGVKPQEARRMMEEERKRDGAEFNVRTLSATEAEARASRERTKMRQAEATQHRKMVMERGDWQSQRMPKKEVRVIRDAWGRATLHVDG